LEFRAYKAIASMAAKKGYRGDLRAVAVQRASAIRKSQRPVKADAEKKLRGAQARKAAAEE
jgi:large subunit ribosomal protein L28e